MKLNDFIRAITALCKEEQNPEVFTWDGYKVVGVDYIDGDIVIIPDHFSEPEDLKTEPEENTLVLKIV